MKKTKDSRVEELKKKGYQVKVTNGVLVAVKGKERFEEKA